ncbi:MAG TPA: PTS sugar transporter subunit IIA [Rectinemataceae bacterium]|nr:PTS sugar transporter subunit IIA [Rectinemataceae bacterium]
MPSSVSLAELIERGGVYYNIGGATPMDALREGVRGLVLPKGIDAEALLTAVLEREALMPTAIGNGVAIPHPRSPIVSKAELQRVAVLFLKTPIPYNALDRKPVSVLFLILSADAKTHLAVLAAISHLCQRRDFQELLAERPLREELTAFIARLEASWEPVREA